MSGTEKVLVVGAGIGGLAAAAKLAQQGKDVDVVEVKPDSTVFGVGINQPRNSLRALREIGVLDEVLAAGFVYERNRFYDYKGQLIVGVDAVAGDDGVPANCALPRRALHNILIGAADRAGATVTYGTTVADLREREDKVEVTLENGETQAYDLVVAFDGIGSAMRRRLFGDGHEPVYTGYAVWRVSVPRPADVVGCDIYQSPNVKGGYIPLDQDTMYLLLVSPEPEEEWYAKEDFARLLSERMVEFEGPLGTIRDGLKVGDDIIYSPLSEVLLPPPWHKGRVVLGGDAAHACTPHITQGAAMALEDAVVLAAELDGADDLDAALSAYTERRYPRAKFVQQVSRGILDAEMAIDAETLPIAVEQMRKELPGQMAGVEEFLDQAA